MEDDLNKHSKDRFLPCLISRLTDDDPQTVKENSMMMFNVDNVRQDVHRNLENILNAHSHLSQKALEKYPHSQHSVLGIGLNDFCGTTAGAHELEQLRKNVEQQILFFEPRIDPETLKVEFADGKQLKHEVTIKISGVIRIHPIDAEIAFSSRMDFETGVANVKQE